MESIKMNSSIMSKSSFEEADNHVDFYKDKTPSERLNYACDSINSIFNSNPNQKVDRTVFFARKHSKQ
jgi:hypothetical protein